jgi:hypothetical protein
MILRGNGMRGLSRIFLIAMIALPFCGAQANTLRETINQGVAKAGTVAKNAARNVDETIGSTIELATGEATPEETRLKLDGMADATLARLFAQNPAARELFDISSGYAVFDTRKSVLLGIAAGFGRGVAVSRESGQRTYMKMATGGVGISFGLGGFSTQVVVLFEDPASFVTFVSHGYDANAQTGAMMGAEQAEESVRFIDGRSFFVLSKKGWKVSATAAGTKYWPDKGLN